jgi:hypothetical protein
MKIVTSVIAAASKRLTGVGNTIYGRGYTAAERHEILALALCYGHYASGGHAAEIAEWLLGRRSAPPSLSRTSVRSVAFSFLGVMFAPEVPRDMIDALMDQAGLTESEKADIIASAQKLSHEWQSR